MKTRRVCRFFDHACASGKGFLHICKISMQISEVIHLCAKSTHSLNLADLSLKSSPKLCVNFLRTISTAPSLHHVCTRILNPRFPDSGHRGAFTPTSECIKCNLCEISMQNQTAFLFSNHADHGKIKNRSIQRPVMA